MKKVLLAACMAATFALALAVTATAHPRFEVSESFTITDTDPCTGLEHDVTFDITFLVHVQNGVTTARGIRTLTTTSGYTGSGTSSYVLNGQVEMFRLNDLLGDGSGSRIRATGLFVMNLTKGDVYVDQFTLTCVGKEVST